MFRITVREQKEPGDTFLVPGGKFVERDRLFERLLAEFALQDCENGGSVREFGKPDLESVVPDRDLRTSKRNSR